MITLDHKGGEGVQRWTRPHHAQGMKDKMRAKEGLPKGMIIDLYLNC